MDRTLRCRLLFDGVTMRHNVAVRVVGGTVASVEELHGEAELALVAPGLVDLQMNGFDDVDVAVAAPDDLARLDEHLLGAGTTHWLGTIVTAPLDRLTRVIAGLDEACRDGAAPGMVGIHIEGPFLGRAPGAHRVRDIVPADADWLAALPPSVRLVTLAPEQNGAIAAVEQLRSAGVVASLGHSRPDRDEYSAAVEAGASMVTHLFNGMSGVHHREGGLALWALTDPRVIAGLIADGVHVAPDAVRLAFLVDGGRRICLVSDSVAHRSDGALARGVTVEDGAPRLPDGTIAGSVTPLSSCVRRAVRDAGVELTSALRSATSVPAGLLGRPDLGSVRVGEVAHLGIWDDDLRVVETVRGLQSARARLPHT
ncbi:MAG: hypothetical protein RL330_1525 [Actinomycetota bacterium]